ncbi:hypothetical protein [Oceanobacillus picturae]|uniref:hypothetical protein n=1 Tax=Oceanobacillus picturae TaxID=171693 RepID=UPI0036416B16
MFKSKKLFYIALIFFFISMGLNFPFPHDSIDGETIGSILNIPIQTVNGFNFVGIISLVLLLVSLFFLGKSLKKYKARAVLIAILISMFLPMMLANLYQKTFATGIYAISYERERSRCEFEMIDEATLHGKCELPFENYRGGVNQFTVEFQEGYEDEMSSLMNQSAPYEVRLAGNGKMVVKINVDIDVSNMEDHIDSGEATEVYIIIKSGDEIRKL